MAELLDVILNDRNILLFLIALAVLSPAVGAAVGAFQGRRDNQKKLYVLNGFAHGLIGTLVLAMWFVYNALTNHYGLDTVKNLLINLAVFIGVGLAAGLILRRLPRPTPPNAEDSAESPPSSV